MSDHTEGHKGSHMARTSEPERLLPGHQIASLSNRLAPRKPTSPKTTDARSPYGRDRQQEPTSTAQPATGKDSTLAPPKMRRPHATQSVTRNVAFSLDIGTQGALRKAARQAETSQAEIIYEALERYIASGGKATAGIASPDALFQRPNVPTPAGPKAVHTLRLPSRNVEVIDDLVSQTGHPNRSALVEAALDAHLNHAKGPAGEGTR